MAGFKRRRATQACKGAPTAVAVVSACLMAIMLACSSSENPVVPSHPLTKLTPTSPAPLSPGNFAGQDEDPALLVTRDSVLLAAWYSNRLGLHLDGRQRKEIFVTRSTDGSNWSAPTQATSDYEWSFYPSLAQAADGDIHLVWMRWRLLPDSCRPAGAGCPGAPDCCTGIEKRIYYNRSSDGLDWPVGVFPHTSLTSGPSDELPHIVAASDGRLLVYFVSGYRSGDTVQQIMVMTNDGSGWSGPVFAAGVNSGVHHETFPHVVERAPGDFAMVWTRYDLLYGGNLYNPSTRTMYSTSTDGLTWSAPVILHEADYLQKTDVFPHLYSDLARQNWYVVWVNEDGAIDLPIAGAYPDDTLHLPIPGYTPRVLPTPTPRIYWAAWAHGAEPTQKVSYRFLQAR